MLCPECKNRSKVTDSRTDGKTVYRRRKCEHCGHIFFTAETTTPSGDAFHKIYNKYKNWRKYYA